MISSSNSQALQPGVLHMETRGVCYKYKSKKIWFHQDTLCTLMLHMWKKHIPQYESGRPLSHKS